MPTIIPSLPAHTYQELKSKVLLVADVVSGFQIDVADGMFVTNRSWPMNPGDKKQFERLLKGEERLPAIDTLEYEVHLMAHNPEKLLSDWVRLGVSRALFHIEAKHDFGALRAFTRKENLELGIALKIGTPIQRLAPYMEDISWVQLMGIAHIGAQGQPFAEEVLTMIREVKTAYPSATIQVDGSVNEATAPRLVQAGADILAPGSYVFNAQNPHTAIELLKHV